MNQLFRHPLTLFSILTILLSQFHLTQAYTLTSTQLLDLQSTTQAAFSAEVANWSASSKKTANIYTLCGTTYLLGGYNVLGYTTGQYFERVYTNLPSHKQISFSLVFWSIDNWSSADSFQLQFDSTLVSAWSLSQRTGLTNICGDSSIADFPSIKIEGKVTHSDTTLTFKVISQITSSTSIASFGIREVQFDFSSPQIPPTTQICAAASVTLSNSVATCTCPSGQYEQLTHSGSCATCHSDCATCNGPSATSCTSCPSGRVAHGTSCITCDKSCATCAGINPSNCLSCASGYRKSVTGQNGQISCEAIQFQGVSEESALNAPLEAGTATFLVLAKTTQFVRYIDMTMPPRLKLLATSRGREILSLRYGFQMPVSMQKEFTRSDLPPVYEMLDLHSNFLVNYWQELTSLGIILAVAFVFLISELCIQSRGKESLQKVFKVIRVLTAWNFCFILLATSLGDIIIYSYLQFSTYSAVSNGSLTGFGLGVCIVVILIMLIFLIEIIRLVKQTYAYKRGLLKEDVTPFYTVRWDGCRVAYDGFYSRRVLSRNFFFIYTIRLGLPSLIAIIAQGSAIAQTILQLIINIAILALVLRLKPLRNRVNRIQLLIIETITLMSNFFVFILAIMDTKNSEVTNAMITLGDLVIVANLLINITLILFLVIKLFLALKEIRATTKDQTGNQILVSCLQLLAIALQQGGMGFEQAFEDDTVDDYDVIVEQISPSKLSPTQILFEPHSACQLTVRASIARHLDDEDPKSTTSNVHFLPSFVENNKSRTSIMRDDMKTEREDTDIEENKTFRKGSNMHQASTNVDSKLEAPTITDAGTLSRATIAEKAKKKSKRGKSVPKNRDVEDRYYMYKEKFQTQQATPELPKKRKNKRKSLMPPKQNKKP